MALPESGTIAVLAEKPSVARDIAHVIGAAKRGEGYLHGNGYVVTWALGHLVALAQPHEMNPEWRFLRRDLLPILPVQWPLVSYEKTRDQFEVVRKILDSPRRIYEECPILVTLRHNTEGASRTLGSSDTQRGPWMLLVAILRISLWVYSSSRSFSGRCN